MNFLAISILAGSLWGAGEVLIWNLLKIANVGMKSPFVFAYGIFILAVSRMLYNKKGLSVLTGLIAVSFKFLHSPIFPCQFIAVMIEALSFEAGFLLIPYFKSILIPLFATYLSYAGFALSAVYILRISGWVKRGISGINHYIFVNGSIAFLLSILAFNLALILAKKLSEREFKTLAFFYKRYGVIFSILFFITAWLLVNI